MIMKLGIFVLDHFVKMKWADGYKMYGVGASMLFGGLGMLAHEFATGVWDDATTTNAFKLVGGGVLTIGAAAKADKLIAATKEASNGK